MQGRPRAFQMLFAGDLRCGRCRGDDRISAAWSEALASPVSRLHVLAGSQTLWPLYAAATLHVLCFAALAPVAGHPYDMVALSGAAEAWLRWGFPLFFHWKFGADLSVVGVLSQGLRTLLQTLGLSGMASVHIAWKLPLLGADLLDGLLIYRLAMRLGSHRARTLAVLWLLNPAILWVSAGHGQLEALSILAMLAGLELLLSRRPVPAGVATALGVGVAYFPMVVIVAAVVWWRTAVISRRALVRFVLVTAVTVLACFLPPVLDPLARGELVNGLASSAGAGTLVSPMSVWAFGGAVASSWWPAVLIISAAAWVWLCLRLAGRTGHWGGAGGGLVAVAVVLLLTLLLDRNTEPQFAAIAVAALTLAAMAKPLSPSLLVMVPLTGLASYFFNLLGGNFDSFWYDAWYRTGARLWNFPDSPQVALGLSHIFAAGVVVALVLVVALRRACIPTVSVAQASIIAVAACSFLAVWSLQPDLWLGVGPSGPAELADFALITQGRQGALGTDGGAEFRLTYAPALIEAARRSSIQANATLEGTAVPLVDREEAGDARPAGEWRDRRVTLSGWPHPPSALRSVWVELLLGSPSWGAPGTVQMSMMSLEVNGLTVRPGRVQWVAPDWARIAFQVPASSVAPDGSISMDVTPANLYWNGGASGPWVRVVPASAAGSVIDGGRRVPVRMTATPDGATMVSGLSLADHPSVDFSKSGLPDIRLTATELRWPDHSLDRGPLLPAAGGAWALLVVVGTVLGFRMLRKPVDAEPSEAER